MIVVAVVGSKKSGKTKTVEALVRGLTKRGYRVATAKHVSEQDFTIDTEGKDTWLHAQAGAKTIVVVAPEELTTIRKADTRSLTLQEIVQTYGNDIDVIVLEGFRSLVERELAVLKIVAVKNIQEATEASKQFDPIIAFTGPVAPSTKLGVPIVDVLTEPGKIVAIVERQLNNFK
ncbi:MAG TPA: molybdopterin-guanine dinucleotide biosynthesis protein B [Candidatus Paceibacterota bacterium]|nr:molybdopterin-guanine dinucleotide biosynthesis protein B [Candidatus Paceibacterota bacterium]